MRTICTLRTAVNGHPDSLRSLLLHPWAPPLSLRLHPDFSCTFVPYFQLLLEFLSQWRLNFPGSACPRQSSAPAPQQPSHHEAPLVEESLPAGCLRPKAQPFPCRNMPPSHGPTSRGSPSSLPSFSLALHTNPSLLFTTPHESGTGTYGHKEVTGYSAWKEESDPRTEDRQGLPSRPEN